MILFFQFAHIDMYFHRIYNKINLHFFFCWYTYLRTGTICIYLEIYVWIDTCVYLYELKTDTKNCNNIYSWSLKLAVTAVLHVHFNIYIGFIITLNSEDYSKLAWSVVTRCSDPCQMLPIPEDVLVLRVIFTLFDTVTVQQLLVAVHFSHHPGLSTLFSGSQSW